MAAIFRLAFHRIAPRARKQSLSDRRWSLIAIDPSTKLLSGTFHASDGAPVPYRIWDVLEPRGIVILLHGAFDYAGAFDEIGPKVAARGLAALAYDQRGFGATRSRRHWCGRKRLVQDVIEASRFAQERFGRLPLFVVGESMGASVAVHAAARAETPQFAGLVLAAPGALACVFRRVLASAVIWALGYLAPNSELVVERVSAWELAPGAAIRLLSDPLVLRGIRPAMAFGLLELATSATEAARKVRVPTLTMVGSKEDFIHAASVKRLHANLAGRSHWHEFKEGPHLLLHWARSQDVLDVALNWIETLLPRSFRVSDPSTVEARPCARPEIHSA